MRREPEPATRFALRMTRNILPPRSAAAALLGLAALAGCSASSAPPPAADTTAEVEAGPPSASADAVQPVAAPEAAEPGRTVGGDGSQIRLEGLTGDEIGAADLEGELTCSFAVGDGAPLLHAAGNVASTEPAQAIVKHGGYVEGFRAPGGFDAMAKGTTFHGRGLQIAVTLTGAATGGGESPPRPARLTTDRADGGRRIDEGLWRCGP